MSSDVKRDQLAIIRIEGMHCHRCEETIRKALSSFPGVHEVETDFNSGQASVLYAPDSVKISQLMDAVNDAGYHATGYTQNQSSAH